MELKDHIGVAWQELKAHRFRSLLTSLGVVMGVGSVLAMVALGDSARHHVSLQVEAMGADKISVRPDRSPVESPGFNPAKSKGLTPEDADALATLPGVDAVSLEGRGWGTMNYGPHEFKFNTMMVQPSYALVHNKKVARGRWLTEEDMLSRAKVCVVKYEDSGPRRWWQSADEFNKVFENGDPLGGTLVIDGVPFKIVGVIEEKKKDDLLNVYWGGWKERALVPYTSYLSRVNPNAEFQGIAVKAVNSSVVDTLMKDMNQLLLHRHRGVKDFSLESLKGNMQEIFNMLAIFKLVLSVIAGVALVVGGVGIMNIMMAVLNERLREIGLRRALGARRRDIAMQFLTESVLLSLLGGFAGIILGIGLALVVTLALGWSMVIRPEAILLAFSFSAGVGLLFGLYPARKASRMSPIDALRDL